jgi:Predicted metalloprotease
MRLEGRRESTNVEDRRGKKTVAAAGGIGIGGIIIYLLISLLGGDPSQVVQMQQQQTEYTQTEDYSEVDVELMQFCKQILAGTEDVWTQEFRKMGRTYQPPKMVIFSGCSELGLWQRHFRQWTILLLCRPDRVSRLGVLQEHETADWRGWRLRIRLRDCP